jgi:hypothetical protein
MGVERRVGVHLDTTTNLETVETSGARAVPARRIAGYAAGVEFIAVALDSLNCCEPGTARAPVAKASRVGDNSKLHLAAVAL